MYSYLRELEIRVASLEREAARGIPIAKLQQMAKRGFLAISAYRPFTKDEETGEEIILTKNMNQYRNQMMREDLKKALNISDAKIIPLKASWIDSSTGAPSTERSFLIPGRYDFEVCKRISAKWEQDAFIWTDGKHPIGMYDRIHRTVTVALDEQLENRLMSSLGPDLYSKSKGGVSFTIDFNFDRPVPWDGNDPITYAEVAQAWGAA